ncbi:MAG: DNA primase [Candidatus Omnitrophica bacterium]|nr:DNA primase [Candidatus Omnitrophota bacterium]
MIPNEVINRILDKTDIVEIISSYVPLKKGGQNFKACCPFHKEKTPSFMVSPGKQIFHCFGCAAGGNVISFLMKHERMDFIEAITMLADKAGITVPRTGVTGKTKNTLADKLYGVNNLACNHYQENLAKEYSKVAGGYLIRRGITERMIKHFRLGFARDSWQGLINYCTAKGIELGMLEKAGLILGNAEGGNWYDRFRNRIIFPIFDLRNRAMGFGGRVLDDSLPKYINSPETYIYTKGRHLYGLNFSKEYIKKQNYAIIVEGYLDLIIPYQNDIRNIVATLGTALTLDQIGMLKRFTKNVIMVYDSDKAGEGATLRGLDLLIEQDMNVRIAVLPKGSDPDSFVRKEGKAGFMKILKESKDLFDYKLGTLTAKFKKDQPHSKARIVAEMLPTLSRIKNAVLKSGYLKKMAEELALDEDSIRTELKKVKPVYARDYLGPRDVENKKSVNQAELALLSMALEDAKFLRKIEEELGFEKIQDRHISTVMGKIDELRKKGKKITVSHLMSCFEDGKIEEIISEATSVAQTIKDKNKVLDDCFRYIKRDNLKKALNNIQSKIKEAEKASDTSKVTRLMSEYNELIKGFGK